MMVILHPNNLLNDTVNECFVFFIYLVTKTNKKDININFKMFFSDFYLL